jgi:hypothetical protein
VARDLTNDMITALTASENRPVIFFEGAFESGTLRFWTGSGVITWDSKQWQGNGLVHGFSLATETGDVEANGVEVILSGVSQSIIQLVLSSVRQGKVGTLWLGMLNTSGAVIGSPYKIFEGFFDTAEINENSEMPEIVIKYETKLIELERARDYRYTTESQKLFNSSDKGFEYVDGLQDWDGFWGKAERKPKKKKREKKAKN